MSPLSASASFGLRLGVFVLALAAAAPGAQQAPAGPPSQPAPQGQEQPQPPRFRVEANFVRVDAYPTADGKPVQDLRQEDFEILEDGKSQAIAAFEHVVVSPAALQASRPEPSSVRAGEQAAANARARVFVFFLDPAHVWFEGAHAVKEPLIRLVDRILGPDDLVALMTPSMSAAQLTFGRKTQVMAEMLRVNWSLGGRLKILPEDDHERQYEDCYLPDEGLVTEMIVRRRERTALDALHDLVRYLGGVREERKAIVAVTNGWRLYGPDSNLLGLRGRDVPGKSPVGVDEFGKLRVNPPRRDVAGGGGDLSVCERERMQLAAMDNEEHFRRLIELANRNNASFYPLDPRRLEVFEYPLGRGDQQPSLDTDRRHLQQRIEVLRTLAEGTDGMAIVNTNDLESGLRRVADDLTSYYLLGYYSSNTKLDGTFRRISVRVKRSGVDVRARRGYRAATAAEVGSARAAESAPLPESVRTANAAIASLGRIRPEQQFSLHAVPLRDASGTITALWVAGELQASAREFTAGSTASIELAGGATGTAAAALKPGERTFLLRLPVQGGAEAIEVKARVTAEAAAVPLAESVRVEPQRLAPQPLLFRRGLSTGNRVLPAADVRFSRTERLRLELPMPAGAAPATGKVLDRNGQPSQVPVQIGEKTDADGQRWLTADAVLAPLGAGDYIVEVSFTAAGTEQRVLTAVRVTR